DGVPDVITAPGPGMAPDVRIFDGTTGLMIRDFMAYNPNFLGGVFLAVGDVTGDGAPDIITGAGAGGGPNVKAFDGKTFAVVQYANRPDLVDGFYAYDPIFMGGVTVAAGDLFGNGQMEIVTGAGPGGGPNVIVFNATTLAIQQYE